jgi:hypothetical protein
MFRYAQRICVFTLAAAGAFAQATSTPAPSAVTTTSTTGMVGLAEGQTARINVLNPGVLAPAMGMICSVHLAFTDGTGKLLKAANVNVAPGQSQSVDLISDTDLYLAIGTRVEIRAMIVPPTANPVTSATPASCSLIGTLEIFDSSTKRTQAVLGGFHDIPAVVSTTPATSSN